MGQREAVGRRQGRKVVRHGMFLLDQREGEVKLIFGNIECGLTMCDTFVCDIGPMGLNSVRSGFGN